MKPLNNVQTGTLGGTLCSIFGTLNVSDVVTTAVLAAIGAVVSYLVSRAMARLGKRARERP